MARVVIVGAGFAGLACARRLAGGPVDVVLLDRNNYHLFTPLLYQVASSLLDPSEIAYPVRAVFRRHRNVRFVLGEAVGADLDRRELRTAAGESFPYDWLVVAAGSESHDFGVEGVRSHGRELKDLPDALALRNRVLTCFERASRLAAPEERRPWLTFVVAGGGPTGVEYAGALAELVRRVLAKDFPELPTSEVSILLVEASPRLLPGFAEPLSERARGDLERLGSGVTLGAAVREVREDAVRLADGRSVPCRTLVWAAGVKPSPLAARLGLPVDPRGRARVDERLRSPGRPEVFVAGDLAAFRQDGRELAMMAPQAIQEGRHAAEAVLALAQGREPAPFRFRHRGVMATIGRSSAVAELGPVRLKGMTGWLAWLALHLLYVVGFRNRLAVLFAWAWSYVLYDRPVRLVVRAKRS